MSLGSTLQEEPDSYLSVEERILLESIDPKKKLTSEIEQDQFQNRDQNMYLKQSAGDKWNLQQSNSRFATMTPRYSQDLNGDDKLVSGMAHGSGAFSSIMSQIPILGPIIGGIASLFGAGAYNGSGAYAPNARGIGAYAPNVRGMGEKINQYVNDNMNELSSMDNKLQSLRGRDQMAESINTGRKVLTDMLPKVANVRPNRVKAFVDQILSRLIPRSFQRHVGSGRGRKKNASEFSPHSSVKTMTKWGLQKIIPDQAQSKAVYQRLKAQGYLDPNKINKKFAKRMKHGKGFWSSLKKVGSKILTKGLPIVANISKEIAPSLVDTAFGHFGIPGADIAKSLITSGLSSVPNASSDKIGSVAGKMVSGLINKSLASKGSGCKGKGQKKKSTYNFKITPI